MCVKAYLVSYLPLAIREYMCVKAYLVSSYLPLAVREYMCVKAYLVSCLPLADIKEEKFPELVTIIPEHIPAH
jgi:hypothetical protein